MEGRISTLEEKLEQQTAILGELMALLKTYDRQKRVLNHEADAESGESSQQGNRNHLKFTPKLEFPTFDGRNPRIWMKKCLKYFNLCKISDNQRVDLASMYMVGRVESWFNSYIVVRQNVVWDEFIVDLCARFKEEISGNVVEEFNKLHQTHSIDDYLDAFENLRSLMLQRNPLLPDQYFLDSFIGGLKPAVKPFVRAFKPQTFASAVEYARLQEESLTVSRHVPKYSPQNSPFVNNKSSSQSSFSNSHSKGLLATPKATTTQTSTSSSSIAPTRFISVAEWAKKIRKRECYFCNEPFTRNHQCKLKGTQMFAIEVIGDEEEEQRDCGEREEEAMLDEGFEMVETVPCISMNALSGSSGFQTMRVTRYVGKKAVHILIDSGSTHNFLAHDMAMKLGCKLDCIEPQSVTVADGSQFPCQLMCKQFAWVLQNTQFEADVLIIPLGGCDMVLGVQWLSTLGTINWNFKNLKMEFRYKDRKHVLRGLAPQKVKTAHPTSKILANVAHLSIIQLVPEEAGGHSQMLCCSNQVQPKADQPVELLQLLQQYADVFDEPTCLPPSRGVFDHRIPLAQNA
ncbi:hypothetical protein RND81_10G238500 [Saponaria officinalis]|uniref:Ty3 transposon capsid-like protein domain-containing protein n=1 Tax=Saponaria officinalis TaxID=3572 RepID=A0AAW1I7C6_SAPOF